MQLSLAELTGGRNPSSRQIIKKIPVSSAHDPATAASLVRKYLGIDLQTQKDDWPNADEALKAWRTSVEAAGVFVFKDSMKQRDVSGFSLHDDQFPLILINNSTAPTRQIFTLFHELAHLLVRVSGVTKQDDSYIHHLHGHDRQVEVFCNRFAAELLLPTSDLKAEIRRTGTDDDGVAKLARAFKVSREVVLRRFLAMRLVTSKHYQEKASQWSKEYEDARASRKGGGNYYATHASYLSQKYAQIAFSKYYRGAISVEQLADYLNTSAGNVAGLEPLVLQKARS
jgi:Zn-dependent peptidase ImmA (M78 family)